MSSHTINSARTAAVATDVFWQPITPDTPRGVRMLLICKASGIAQVSTVFAKEAFFTHWAPLPKWSEGDKL
jgi:hypothetical protein